MRSRQHLQTGSVDAGPSPSPIRKYQMTTHFARGMTKATELTKAGKLTEATALIQSLLSDKSPETTSLPENTVIEGEFTPLDGTNRADTTKPAPVPRGTKQPRASLRETLRKIAAGGMPGHARMPKPRVPVPDGAEFVTMTHRAAGDQRDYKLYIPANRPSAAMPLIVMLHGCTQSPDDFAAGTGMNALAEQHGFLVAYPAQPNAANANKCWNWFKAEDQGRDRGEPALIAGLTRDIVRDYPVDKGRIFVAGLSAGGATAAIMGAAYPDLFSAVGVHSGLAIGAATDIPQAFSAMRSGSSGKLSVKTVPTIVFHGLADVTVHPRNGDAVTAQALSSLGGLKGVLSRGKSEGGRSYRKTRYADQNGCTMCEHWEIDGAGHAWAGGHSEGSYTDPIGPSASQEMLRFFMQHVRR